MLYYTKQKFAELSSFDIRLGQQNRAIEELTERIDNLQEILDKQESMGSESDRHMTRYMPLQMASMIYDVLKKNFSPSLRPKLHAQMKDLIEGLEKFTLKTDEVIPFYGALNFKKLEYSLPDFSGIDDQFFDKNGESKE